jgi:hypothetical protein
MGWFVVCGEFMGSAAASFVLTSAKLKQKELVESTDFCPDETKQFIAKSLESCRPANKDLTWWGRRITEFNLGRNDYFGSLLGIDAHTKLTKRTICIVVLKTAAKCICAGYNEDEIRAVTYSYLALRNIK